MRQWEEDIRVFMPCDKLLIKAVIEVNNEERPENQIDIKILDKLTIDYQQPKVVSDEQAEWDLVLSKAPKGADSVVEFVMKNDPELTEPKAIEKIKARIKEWDELFGSKFNIPMETDSENQGIDNETGTNGGDDQSENETDNNGGTKGWDAGQRSGQEKDNGENQSGSGGTAAKDGGRSGSGVAKK
jgi:hypothetical protein